MSTTDTQTPATDVQHEREQSVIAGREAKPEPASKPARNRQPSAATRKSSKTHSPRSQRSPQTSRPRSRRSPTS
jgi:hypothetical protein